MLPTESILNFMLSFKDFQIQNNVLNVKRQWDFQLVFKIKITFLYLDVHQCPFYRKWSAVDLNLQVVPFSLHAH